MGRLNVSDLGETEVVSTAPTLTSHKDRHVEALEKIVDDLREENILLKLKLKAKPTTIAQEMYDELCARYQLECSKSIPF